MQCYTECRVWHLALSEKPLLEFMILGYQMNLLGHELMSQFWGENIENVSTFHKMLIIVIDSQ